MYKKAIATILVRFKKSLNLAPGTDYRKSKRTVSLKKAYKVTSMLNCDTACMAGIIKGYWGCANGFALCMRASFRGWPSSTKIA